MSEKTILTIELDPDEYGTKEVNQSGSLFLGKELQGKTVRYAFEVVDNDE